jgi:hypothetical protein
LRKFKGQIENQQRSNKRTEVPVEHLLLKQTILLLLPLLPSLFFLITLLGCLSALLSSIGNLITKHRCPMEKIHMIKEAPKICE